MFQISFLLVFLLTVMTACGNIKSVSKSTDQKVVNSNKSITTGRVTTGVYQSLMEDGKYQTSVARGLSASRLNSNYNLTNFENGLTKISQEAFSVDQYYFREGQKISYETLQKWLSRKSATIAEGLNPEISADTEDQQKANPIIFQQLEEYDFINKDSQKLAGVSLGIALNKVYYTTNSSVEIDEQTMQAKGKEVAAEIIARVRKIDGMKDIPITIALFEQAEKEDLAGGHYFAKATSKAGSSKISKWQTVSENYVSLPVINDETNEATADGISSSFTSFKSSIQGFFPNLSGVTGIAYYQGSDLQKLTIKIETNYYSKTEITSFTQYVGKTAESAFNTKGEIEIQISSLEGEQAFLTKKSGEDTMTSHIFN